MKKHTPTDHPIHELLSSRWSPRAFGDEPVTEEQLRALLEAARWAPSAFNEQPWRFIVARREDGAAHEQLASVLFDSNRRWAASAPVLMLGVTATHLARTGNPNRHAQHDLGQAIAHMCVQATALGLGVHQMGGFDADLARERFGIPEGFEPMTAIAIGPFGDPEQLEDDLRQRELSPRSRRAQEEFVFTGAWGEVRG